MKRFAVALALLLSLLVPSAATAQNYPVGANLPVGAVLKLQGAPHIWINGEVRKFHWGGDTRALAGKQIVWSPTYDVTLQNLKDAQAGGKMGDPWLSSGLVKVGDPIYLSKWESDQPAPTLQHIQSIADVELFGINGNNYGQFVIDQAPWERRYGFSVATLRKEALAAAVVSQVQPVMLSGRGQTATALVTPPAAPAKITFTHRGTRNFIVWAHQGGGRDLLVNVIGNYDGTRPLLGSGPVMFDIQADGDWSLKIEPIASGGAVPFSGRGDSVSAYFTPPTTAGALDVAHTGRSNFIVYLRCVGGNSLVQNEIGAVTDGRIVTWGRGPCYWDVRGDGSWSLTPR